MRRALYLVRISRDPDSDWGASVPDLPGCVATGKTLDSALRRIEIAISLHLAGMMADGIKPPLPKCPTVTPRRTAHRVEFYATIEIPAGLPPTRLPVRTAGMTRQRSTGNAHVRDAVNSQRRRRG
jgi:predicted RNase H-like HicB family nuclease